MVVVALEDPGPVEPFGGDADEDDADGDEVDAEDEEDDAALDWLASSSASFASSAARVDWSEDTDSLMAVVSKVASVCPALTC